MCVLPPSTVSNSDAMCLPVYLSQAALPLEESDRVAPADGKGDPGTLVATRTTLSDLYDTLRKLEEEENFLTQRSEKRTSLCK